MTQAHDFVLGSAKRRYKRSDVVPGGVIRSLHLDELRQWKFRPFDEDGSQNAANLRTQDAALIQLCLCDLPADVNGDEIRQATQTFLPEQVSEIACMDAGLGERLMAEIESHLELSTTIDDAKKNYEMTEKDTLDTS